MFKLNFATPEKKIVTDQELEEISLPAFRGELNILPGHSPLMTTLEAGVLSYRLKGGTSQKLAIGWGYCQVSPEGVNVLAETAADAADINTKSVEKSLDDLEKVLMTETLDDQQWDKAQQDISRMKAELSLSKKTTH
jgi:F-type H+-transporting ATPase subunit epsilon